jgi:cytochrome c-type biogenesis protein CcmH/NrfG
MRKLIFILLALTALLFAGYAGFRGYRVWRQNHMVSLARQFMAKGDGRNAQLALSQVLNSNPRNLEALRLLATLAEASRSSEAVIIRGRVAQLAPASADDGLALARTALIFKDLTTASNALQRLPESARTSAGYHEVAAGLFTVTGQFKSAEDHWLKAAELEPTNKVPTLNLATLRMHETNFQVQAEARATLNELSKDPRLSCLALRELLADAARNHQTNAAMSLAAQLVAQTNSTFSDKILQLELQRESRDPAFPSHLSSLQHEAAKDAAKTYELVNWQMAKIGPADSLAWMTTLPADVQTNQPVALLCADCRNTLKDWTGLQSSLEHQNWGELEFMRHALVSRALKEQDLDSSAKTEWEAALQDASGQKEKLAAFLRLVSYWNLPSEQEQLLWIFVNQFPAERWAPELLARLLYIRGRTQGLLSLFSQLSQANPSDLAIKNNLAITALLLDASQFKPQELAREVYEKAPTNASYASTYAFALLKQKEPNEALKIIQQLKANELEKPSIAAYYAILLQATGHKNEVKKYADLAAKGPLLPEERKLLEGMN